MKKYFAFIFTKPTKEKRSNAKSLAELTLANYSQSKSNYNHLLCETSLAASDCKGPTRSQTCALRKALFFFFSLLIYSSRRFLAALCHSSNNVRVTPASRCDNLLLRGETSEEPCAQLYHIICGQRGEAKPRTGCPQSQASLHSGLCFILDFSLRFFSQTDVSHFLTPASDAEKGK